MNKKDKRIGFIFLVLILLLSSLRYIFLFNSTGTSPTYSNTPLWYHVLKYIIICLFSIWLYLKCNIQNHTILVPITLVIISYFVIINVFNVLLYGSYSQDIKLLFLIIFIFLPLILIDKKDLYVFRSILNDAILFCVPILIFMELIAVGNYMVFDRLPALAYAHSLVRFGSFWDDPNGFGFFSAFFSLYFLWQKRFFFCGAMFICLILTVSFSSYVVFFIGISILSLRKKSVRLLVFVCLLMLISILYFWWDQVLILYALKEGSIKAHLGYSTPFHFLPLINSSLFFNESWTISMLVSYFPGSIILFALAIVSVFYVLLSKTINMHGLFVVLFFIGNVFIPYVYSFPVNIIFCCYLAFFLRLKGVEFAKYKKISH